MLLGFEMAVVVTAAAAVVAESLVAFWTTMTLPSFSWPRSIPTAAAVVAVRWIGRDLSTRAANAPI